MEADRWSWSWQWEPRGGTACSTNRGHQESPTAPRIPPYLGDSPGFMSPHWTGVLCCQMPDALPAPLESVTLTKPHLRATCSAWPPAPFEVASGEKLASFPPV